MNLGHISSSSETEGWRDERDNRCHGTEAVYCHCDSTQDSGGTNSVSH